MQYYFIPFFITLVFLILGTIVRKNNIITQVGIAAVAAIPLAFISGVRTLVIGTDIKNYGLYNFNLATQFSDFADYFAKITISNQTEVGYALLNYVVSKFSNNINVFFFWLEFIIIFLFLWAAFRYESLFGISSVIQFVVFFGLFYGPTMNLMRQSVAMVLVYLGASFLFDSRWSFRKSFTISLFPLALATTFHRTSVVAVAIWFVYLVFKNAGDNARRRFGSAVFVGTAGLILSFLIIKFGVLNSLPFMIKYTSYLNGDNYLVTATTSPSRFLLTIVPIGFALVIMLATDRQQLQTKIQITDAVFFTVAFIALMDIATQISGLQTGVFQRMGLYFYFFEVLILPFSGMVISKRNHQITAFIVIGIYALYMFYHITKLGEGEIYPYYWILGPIWY